MMMRLSKYLITLPQSTQRYIALACLAFVAVQLVYIIVYLIPGLYSSHLSWRDKSLEKIHERRYWQLNKVQIRDQLIGYTQSPIMHALYSENEDNFVSGFQQDINIILNKSNIDKTTVDLIDSRPFSDAVSEHHLRVKGVANIEALGHFLQGVRNNSKLFRVQEVSISAPKVNSLNFNPEMDFLVIISCYSVNQ
jgi:hypothetical protein